MWAQQEIGFIEKFATAEDRRGALQDLIPGTEEYYYYHCLHYQNEKQLSEAQAVLDQWKAKYGENSSVSQMQARQVLLAYDGAPEATINFLRDKLQVQLNHAPPSRDRAAALASAIAPDRLDPNKLIEAAIARDRSFSQLQTSALPRLVGREMAPDQLRAWLKRLDRADINGLVKRIAEELALKDTPGFGWAPVHNMLTIDQLDELLKLRPALLQHENYIRAFAARLAPPDGTNTKDPKEQRLYIERMVTFARRLPPSQSSFKALVLGNLLRLNLREGKFDRPLFLEYLALPRNIFYYSPARLQNPPVTVADLNYAMQPQVVLPPVGDDTSLVRRYLEHFFQSSTKLDDLAQFIERKFLEDVLAETKILYGDGDSAAWYAKLEPAQQKALRERIELRFGPENKTQFSANDAIELAVELKNVSKLLVKIYEINPRNYYRTFNRPLSTDVDLDGLVANAQRQFEYTQSADRRHVEKIALPELNGRGAWVVDFLGGGQRSRVLIQKGSFSSVQSLSDVGHMLQVFDEAGQQVKTAHAEIKDQSFAADSQGRIFIPYVEAVQTQNVLLVDGEFASQEALLLQNETYQLQARFVIDRQALVAGTIASVLVRAQLQCTGRPVSLKLLEKAQLTISATDLDGLPTTQTTGDLELSDSGELVHKFLVPQRLANIDFKLTGKVYNRSRDVREDVSAGQSLACNGNLRGNNIGGFFLQPNASEYRLLVLGRNGEPVPKLPVAISFQSHYTTVPESVTLATDASGEVNLGTLPAIWQVNCTAQGVEPRVFAFDNVVRTWPSQIHLALNGTAVLPLGSDDSSLEHYSLLEIKQGVACRELNKSLKIADGALTVGPLPMGNYQLRDYRRGGLVRLAVIEKQSDSTTHLIGATRALELGKYQPLVIKQTQVQEKEIRIQLGGFDKFTRVHVIAHPLEPDLMPSAQIALPYPGLTEKGRMPASSFYINSLQLDEEYSYILQRQQATKYPGNMLVQPSMLVHPWEISLSDNQAKLAEGGDAVPSAADPMNAPAPAAPAADFMSRGSAENSVSHDFLAHGTLLAGNLTPDEKGEVAVPREALKGYTTLVVLAVHPMGADSRNVLLPHSPLSKRDLRLKSAFEAQTHLAETQSVRVLKAGEKTAVGDARTSRAQVYATLGDVYRLYETLLKNGEWEKFRFVTQWDQLSEDEKKARYSEMSCHELDYFLYRKDRKFFDAVAAPLLQQKLDKQLVDLWLLDKPIDAYQVLWRIQRLNTLERILLSQKLKDTQAGTRRWLDEFLVAHPLDAAVRSQRFETALRGSLLDGATTAGLEALGEAVVLADSADFAGGLGGMMGGMGGGRGADRQAGGALGAPAPGASARPMARDKQLRMGRNMLEKSMDEKLERKKKDAPREEGMFFDAERANANFDGPAQPRFFQTLEQTRQWAETQYYHVRLEAQKPELIPPSPFWQELMQAADEQFLSQNMDLPVTNVNEALLALAVLDLPWQTTAPEMNVENDRLVITTQSPAIAFVQSIEKVEATQEDPSMLVGQDIYLAEPHTEQEAEPIKDKPLLIGVPYRTSVVVTNPTSTQKVVHVLCQLPAGAMPLSASRVTRSTPVTLGPYSTAQVQYNFYFPSAGQFDHYGSQVSSSGKHITATPSTALRVLPEPESVDETTWSYIADWGTNQAVLEYLAKANLQRLDLSRIAFRMQDKEFYAGVLALLAASGRFEPTLWAYALLHNDAINVTQLLHNRPDFTGLLGPVLRSTLLTLDPQEQMSYEHLEYKPIVVARIHQLGAKRVILNDKLHQQYQKLLSVAAHQSKLNDDQRMELCYYLLIQNRIEEAIGWFDQVNVDNLATRLQYDYFDAYLDFFRGKYERASQIAGRYAEYPVPRWRELFSEIGQQVKQREALISGQELTSVTSLDSGMERADRLLTDRRESQQNRQAAESPALDLNLADGVVTVNYRNLDELKVNYYLMDIELLFSRNPFAAQGGGSLPAIRPNFTESLKLPGGAGAARKLELPDQVRNRNVLVEVTSKGISRTGLLTANTLSATVVEPYGRVQVRGQADRAPVEAAYVKVYARHQDGSVRFFKDGYTDLRGQFDYATLSTNDLSTAQRLSILIIDPKHGALVREAAPPTR